MMTEENKNTDWKNGKWQFRRKKALETRYDVIPYNYYPHNYTQRYLLYDRLLSTLYKLVNG